MTLVAAVASAGVEVAGEAATAAGVEAVVSAAAMEVVAAAGALAGVTVAGVEAGAGALG